MTERTFKIADYLLKPLIMSLVSDGRVMAINKHWAYRNRYMFFREKASLAFRPPSPPSTVKYDENGGVLYTEYRINQATQEGFYYAEAMLDAYFDYLEHILVLLYAFEPDTHDVTNFMSSDWTQKFNRIFKPNPNSNMICIHENVQTIKERYRNTFSNGDYEKGGNPYLSLYLILILYIDSVPLTLSKYKDSVHFDLFPMEEPDFEWVCQVIHDFESAVEQDVLMRRKFEILQSGLEIRLNYVDEYSRALESDDLLHEFLKYGSYVWERSENMDW